MLALIASWATFVARPVLSRPWGETCMRASYCHAATPSCRTYRIPSKLRLLQVHVITRHGDRTPMIRPQNDTIDWSMLVDNSTISELFDGSLHEDPNALLTVIGRSQHNSLGRALRDIYVEQLRFLPTHSTVALHSDGGIHVRSTRYTRTVLSVKALLSGLYPNDYDTIPVDLDEQDIHIDQSSCPRLNQLMRQIHEAAGQQINEMIPDLNVTDKSLSNFFNTADQYFCRACHAMPTFTPQKDYCSLARFTFRYILQSTSESLELLRRHVGSLLRELIRNLEASMLELNGPKFTIFSAHDTTIAYLLCALQSGNYEWPPYAANFILELWSRDQDNQTDQRYQRRQKGAFIRILYNGKLIRLSWCNDAEDGLCSLEAFLQFVYRLVPTKGAAQCQLD